MSEGSSTRVGAIPWPRSGPIGVIGELFGRVGKLFAGVLDWVESLQTAVGTAQGIGPSMVPESVRDHPDQFPDCSDLSPGATPTDSDREGSTGSTSDSTTQLEFKSQEFYAVDSVGDLNYSASNL